MKKKRILLTIFLCFMCCMLGFALPTSASAKNEPTYLTTTQELYAALSRREAVIYLGDISFVEDDLTLSLNYSVKLIGKAEKSTLKNVHFLVDGARVTEDSITVELCNLVLDGGFDVNTMDTTVFDGEAAFEDIFGSDREDDRCINTVGYYHLSLMGCEVTGYAAERGAALYINNPTALQDALTLDLTDCKFYRNLSQNGTVFVFHDKLTTTVKNCEFTDNYAGRAAGIHIANGKAELDNVNIHDNHFCQFAGLDFQLPGGGLGISGASATIKNSEIVNNETIYGGGVGVCSAEAGSSITRFINCKISNNEADCGGAVYISSLLGQPIYFLNCEFSDNSAKTGSSLYTVPYAFWTGKERGGLVECSFCSFLRNTAEDDNSFGFYDMKNPEQAGTISLLGCVISDHTTRSGLGEAPDYTYISDDTAGASKVSVSKDAYSDWGGGAYAELSKDLQIGVNEKLSKALTPTESGGSGRRMVVPILYGLCTLVSLLLLIYYCFSSKEKHLWMLLMQVSVFIANLGYLTLSLSKSLTEAMLANRIAYLGNAFMPMLLILVVSNVCRLRYKKWMMRTLFAVSVLMFLFAVSAGYSQLFYTSVSYEMTNGIVGLSKEYGCLHTLYSVYILVYYCISVGIVVYSIVKKKLVFHRYITSMLLVGSVNIVIWGIEHLFGIHYELLSFSYLFTVAMLCMIYSQMAENGLLDSYQTVIHISASPSINASAAVQPPIAEPTIAEPTQVKETVWEEDTLTAVCNELSQTKVLSKREIEVLILLLKGSKRSDIADALFVTENTVKTHTSHIYTKLNVNSREELQEKLCTMLLPK